MLSPVLFCLYLDGLLSLLARSGVGCLVGECYVGALAYADDIVLLAPTANAMRHMLKVCDNYASDYSIIFNASKSKCILFSHAAISLRPLVLNQSFLLVTI